MPFKSLVAAKAQLVKLNAAQVDIDSIETIDDANELVQVYEAESKKNAAPKVLTQKAGIPLLDNKPPEQRENSQTLAEEYTREELMNPLCPSQSRVNMADPENGRLLKFYDDEHPNGVII